MLYTAGRLWIEMLRIAPAEHVLGVRLNVWTSRLVGGGALVMVIISNQRQPGREESVWLPGREPEVETSSASETDNCRAPRLKMARIGQLGLCICVERK